MSPPRGVTPVGGMVSANPILNTYSATVTWPGNTVTSANVTYVQTGRLVTLWGSFTESAGTAVGVVTIALPSGLTFSAFSLVGGLVPTAALSYVGLACSGTTLTSLAFAGSVQNWAFYASVLVS